MDLGSLTTFFVFTPSSKCHKILNNCACRSYLLHLRCFAQILPQNFSIFFFMMYMSTQIIKKQFKKKPEAIKVFKKEGGGVQQGMIKIKYSMVCLWLLLVHIKKHPKSLRPTNGYFTFFVVKTQLFIQLFKYFFP